MSLIRPEEFEEYAGHSDAYVLTHYWTPFERHVTVFTRSFDPGRKVSRVSGFVPVDEEAFQTVPFEKEDCDSEYRNWKAAVPYNDNEVRRARAELDRRKKKPAVIRTTEAVRGAIPFLCEVLGEFDEWYERAGFTMPHRPDGDEEGDSEEHVGSDPPTLERRLSDLVDRIEEVVEKGEDSDRDRLLSLKDVADLLNVSERTVESIVANGDLRPVRIRGVRRFDPRAVRDYVRASTRRIP